MSVWKITAGCLSDAQLATTWVNTLTYVVLAVLAEIILGVLAAALINQIKTGRQWVLAAVILPWALPGVVNSVIWLWIYQPGAGLLNGILVALGTAVREPCLVQRTAPARSSQSPWCTSGA